MSTDGTEDFILESEGYCPTCGDQSKFVAKNIWLRDNFACVRCRSIPRERALMACIEQFVPHWRTSSIHESSPGFLHGYRGASDRLRRNATSYTTSQYDTSMPLGSIHPVHGYQAENLECMTFPDNAFDLFVTQDVFEHLFHPDRAIKEIARVLKPGGTYLMTVPIQNTLSPSNRRATIDEKTAEINYLMEAVYHGGSLHDGARSLVTVDWGYDILDYLAYHSGLSMTMVYIDDVSRGIKAEMIEVIMMRRPAASPLML